MTFQMWSTFHFLLIASPFIFTLVFYFVFKGKEKKKLRIAGIVFSCIGITLLIARNLSIYGMNQVITPEVIPLQVCHLANFILLFAFLFNSQTLFVMALSFNLPAAFLSLVFANGLSNYSTLFSWQGAAYIFGHMLIVGITLWEFSLNMIKFRFNILLKVLGIIIGLYILSIPVNNLFMKLMPGFKSNYFYTFVPEDGTPLQSLFDMGHNITLGGIIVNPIYIVTLMITGLSVVFFTYGTFLVLSKMNTRVESSEVLKNLDYNHGLS